MGDRRAKLVMSSTKPWIWRADRPFGSCSLAYDRYVPFIATCPFKSHYFLRLLLRLHQPKAKSASITIFESQIKSSRFLGVFIRVCLFHGVLPFYDTNEENHDTPWYTMKFPWFSPHFSSRTMALSSRNPSGIQTWQLKNPTFTYMIIYVGVFCSFLFHIPPGTTPIYEQLSMATFDSRPGSHRAGVSERSAATTTRRRGTGLPKRSRVALASWSRNVGVENPHGL